MIGGYISSVIVRPFRSIPLPSYFFWVSFGLFFSASFRAWAKSFVASPSIEFGMKELIFVILMGSASEGMKVWICDLSRGIEA